MRSRSSDPCLFPGVCPQGGTVTCSSCAAAHDNLVLKSRLIRRLFLLLPPCAGTVGCHAGSGLDDLSAPVQQQFEELSVTNPRLYFSNIQQQQQPGLQQPQGAELAVTQEGAGGRQQQQQRQPQDVVRLLQSIDPHALSDQPMAGPVANKVCGCCSGEGPRGALLTQEQGRLVCRHTA